MEREILDPEEKGKKVKCLSCGSPREGFFCYDCHTLLPISGEMDYFAMLEVEKRPVVDTARLKDNFLKMSETVHPDRYYNSSPEVQELALKCSSLLNKAYSTLKDPKERIKYLISLETDKEAPVSSRASTETMEFFIEASDVCSEVDAFIKKKGGDESLLRDYQKNLHRLKKETQDRWKGMTNEIETVDKEWATVSGENRKPLLRRLLVLSHELSYLSKLHSLIDELIVGIS
ncbi:MAG: Fe-S protein assembly co-chaperone HscB [Nitrospirae bacterium]|nr:Fe-S protein assembly co-chaperone HscB [Nitrospirota bacterium]